MNRMYSKKVHILVFLFPALLLFCGVLIAPIGASAYFSFFKASAERKCTLADLACDNLYTAK